MEMLILITLLKVIIDITDGQGLFPFRLVKQPDDYGYRYSIVYRSPSEAVAVWYNPYNIVDEHMIRASGESFHQGTGESHIVWSQDPTSVYLYLPYDSRRYDFTIRRGIGITDVRNVEIMTPGGHISYVPGTPTNVTFRFSKLSAIDPYVSLELVSVDSEREDREVNIVTENVRFLRQYPTVTWTNDYYEMTFLINLRALGGIAFLDLTYVVRNTWTPSYEMKITEMFTLMQQGYQSPFPPDLLTIGRYGPAPGRSPTDVMCYRNSICSQTWIALGTDIVSFRMTKAGTDQVLSTVGYKGPHAWMATFQIPSFDSADEGEYVWQAANRNGRIVKKNIRLRIANDSEFLQFYSQFLIDPDATNRTSV